VPGEGERLAGASGNACNLSSVLYHGAQGGTQYAKYIEDAERARQARALLAGRQ
jgi:hypothetical protein